MTEKLDYIRLDDDQAGPCLVIQVTGGGVAERFPAGLPSHVVANRLRDLADRLDLGVEDRAGKETPPECPHKHVTADSRGDTWCADPKCGQQVFGR